MDCPGIESQWDAIFRAVQTGLEVHFASCTMGIRSFTGEKQPERGFEHLFLVPGCEWVGITPPLPLCACTGMSWNGLYLHYIIIYYFKKFLFSRLPRPALSWQRDASPPADKHWCAEWRKIQSRLVG